MLEKKPPRASIAHLQKLGLLQKNERFYDKNKQYICSLLDKNKVSDDTDILSIHKMAAKYLKKQNYNGWNYFYILKDDKLISINKLRYECSLKDN